MSVENDEQDLRSWIVEGASIPFGSLWTFLIVLGTLTMALGAFLLTDVLAGMFGIWGATAAVVGLLGHAIVWFARP